MTRRRGFTLIELLVVIAIIAILAAILFPVFAQARAKARAISCLSNTKQLALGLMQYTQDYDEMFPNWNWNFYCNGGNAGAPRDSASFWTMAIYPYVKNVGVYKCPDDVLQWNDNWDACSDDRGLRDLFGPYRANGTICEPWQSCNPNFVSYGIPDNLAGGTPTNKLAGIPTPANWLMLADSASQLVDVNGWGGPAPNEDNWIAARAAFASQKEGCCMMWQCCWTASQWMAGNSQATLENATRHSGGGNMAFVDGHSKWTRWQNMTWIKLTLGSR